MASLKLGAQVAAISYRSCLALALAMALLSAHDLARGVNLPTELPSGEYSLETAFQIESPISIASPNGVTEQIYVAQRRGRIQVAVGVGADSFASTPFLDISDRVVADGENGLLGLAFHPNYQRTGRFFVFYSVRVAGSLRQRLSRFERSSENPLQADPQSEVVLIEQIHRASNHNGGDLHFGPDGYLYVSLGDEGGGNDTYNNGQRIDGGFFSGLLRIDVDKRDGNVEPTVHAAVPRDADGEAAYSVPADNPLVPQWTQNGSDAESPSRLEFYAIGLRNPWRFSFDDATGRLWLADVGQSAREEVNLIERGGNYGWAAREGTLAGPKAQSAPAGFETFSEPIFEYGRDQGISITGGVVYRGSRLPELHGAYVFGDYGSGRIFALFYDPGTGATEVSQIASLPGQVAYGMDPSNGDILISSISGAVLRLTRGDQQQPHAFPELLSETGAFVELANLTPTPEFVPYQVNLPFWSDHALKTRWVAIPEGAAVGYREDAPWEFPPGTVWVKHFELETDRGNPESSRPIETRFLVKTSRAAYGLSYRWNEAGDEAALAHEDGEDVSLQIQVDGQTVEQVWSIPSRQDCLSCHTEAAGFALSFDSYQLNRARDAGDEENTIAFLSRIGVLREAPENPSSLPRHYRPDEESVSLEQRAVSYLAVNCSSCHQPGGGGPSNWDARPFQSMNESGLLNRVAQNDGGDPQRRLVSLGHPERSILLHRLLGLHGQLRMPPIGSNEVDPQGAALLTRWIERSPPPGLDFASWQAHYFGSANIPAAGPEEDPDGDGNANRLEYLTGTDPLDPINRWLPEFEIDEQGLTARFAVHPDRRFTLQASSDLENWSVLPNDGQSVESRRATMIDGQITIPAAPTDSPDSFYRILVQDLVDNALAAP